MEVDWLEDFLALNSTGVFAKAAHARNISQSAFTRRIKNLEHWVGVPLFDRSRYPVVLTAAGKEFRKTAHQTVRSLRIVKEDLHQISRRDCEVLNITALHTLAISFLPTWLKNMSESIGSVNTSLSVENFSGCVESLMAGTDDFMLCYDHPAVMTLTDDTRFPSIKITEDRLVAVSGVDVNGEALFGFEQQGKLPFLGYSSESFLGRLSEISIERAAIADKLELRYETSVAEVQKAACVEGLGIAWLPYMSVEPMLITGSLRRISNAYSERTMAVKLYRSTERSNISMERFWTLARTTSSEVN